MQTVTEWRHPENRSAEERDHTLDLTEGADRPGDPASGGPARGGVHVVTGVHPLSVAKVSAVFFGVLAVVAVLTATLLWITASSVGLVGAVEGFMADLGFEGFSFDALVLLRAAMLASLAVLCGGVGVTVLFALLYNLVSLLTGGIRFEVREAGEVPPRTPAIPSRGP